MEAIPGLSKEQTIYIFQLYLNKEHWDINEAIMGDLYLCIFTYNKSSSIYDKILNPKNVWGFYFYWFKKIYFDKVKTNMYPGCNLFQLKPTCKHDKDFKYLYEPRKEFIQKILTTINP